MMIAWTIHFQKKEQLPKTAVQKLKAQSMER
jgi:hypothetical protein